MLANGLIVTTETEQNFDQSSFTETVERNENQYPVTYNVNPDPIRHFPPGYDNSNPDTHKYWFLLLNQQTNMV